MNFSLLEADLQDYKGLILNTIIELNPKLLALQSAIPRLGLIAKKDDGTLVTKADLLSETIILGVIKDYAPQPFSIISEESNFKNFDNNRKKTWYIDPLDGTRNYINGSKDYAILISEWHEQLPIFSIISYPAYKQIAIVVSGHISWLGQEDYISTVNSEKTILSCYMNSKRLANSVSQRGFKYQEFTAESTRAFFEMAKGNVQGVICLICGHQSWDIAPLLHLVTASGGHICNEFGRQVILNGESILAKYIIAATNQSDLQKLCECVKHLESDTKLL